MDSLAPLVSFPTMYVEVEWDIPYSGDDIGKPIARKITWYAKRYGTGPRTLSIDDIKQGSILDILINEQYPPYSYDVEDSVADDIYACLGYR